MLEDAASSLLRVVQEDEGASTALFEMGAMPKLVELVESVNEELQARHLELTMALVGDRVRVRVRVRVESVDEEL